ncbi:hypothetical protein IHE61_14130 [Streptomyces sp. GKU 257-1]|nr:hypothetical protein [Streptomyces sp. GKU 257-1]
MVRRVLVAGVVRVAGGPADRGVVLVAGVLLVSAVVAVPAVPVGGRLVGGRGEDRGLLLVSAVAAIGAVGAVGVLAQVAVAGLLAAGVAPDGGLLIAVALLAVVVDRVGHHGGALGRGVGGVVGAQVGDLQRGGVRTGGRAAAAPAGAGATAECPPGGEPAPYRERDEGLPDGEGRDAEADHDDRRQRRPHHHTEEAGEGQQPPAQPGLVLEQYLAQQPQRTMPNAI